MSTQVNPISPTTERTHQAVVAVGVDGSTRNRAAVAWAHHEAADLNGRLVLVGASHTYAPSLPPFTLAYSDQHFRDLTQETLEGVRDDLGASADEVPVLVALGGAPSVLLEAAEQADVLVMGKRGLGAVKRMLVGSNSIAVAGRSPVPVVVVPDAWVPATKRSAPVVVGLEGSTHDDEVLEYAFSYAARLAVPLMAVHAWQLPAVYSWSPDDVTLWTKWAEDEAATVVGPWSDRYPDVEVVTRVTNGNAAMAVLDAAAVAQLVVLGRQTGPHHAGGFHLGSTTRAVLHYSECPVAIIPSSSAHPSVEFAGSEKESSGG